MNLESLPNELLLNLFGYLDGINLLRAFYSLNSRFNHLLYRQFLFYRFSFRSISKRDFDYMCQKHLPFVADRVIYLRLSDSNETPEQINLFLSYIPSFTIFTHLQSLIIFNLRSYPVCLKLLDQCQHLLHLSCVLFNCRFSEDFEVNFQLITNKIWSLPKLAICHLNIGYVEEGHQFQLPTIRSTSIERISIYDGGPEWNDMNQLMQYTPHLKYLRAFVNALPDSNNTVTIFPTIVKCVFKLYNVPKVTNAELLFKSIPNLQDLNINIKSGLMDGHQWGHIIRNHLPRLKIFQLAMLKHLNHFPNTRKTTNKLYNSFCTPFWIYERKWFIWCFTKNRTIYLCTRSNAFTCFDQICPDSWRSTWPDDTLPELYNHVTKISDRTVFNKPPLSNIRLPNIEHLRIKFPINDRFWSIVSSLKQLRTLSITSYSDTYQFELQKLFDRAPHLQSLSVNQYTPLPLQISLFTRTNASIRELDLFNCHYCFNDEACLQLTRSNLSSHCEVLSIRVSTRESILILVRHMDHLRSLIVQSEGDQYQNESVTASSTDELVEWLQERLPLSHLIVRDPDSNDDEILIWI